jgi:hypothetical protein
LGKGTNGGRPNVDVEELEKSFGIAGSIEDKPLSPDVPASVKKAQATTLLGIPRANNIGKCTAVPKATKSKQNRSLT